MNQKLTCADGYGKKENTLAAWLQKRCVLFMENINLTLQPAGGFVILVSMLISYRRAKTKNKRR